MRRDFHLDNVTTKHHLEMSLLRWVVNFQIFERMFFWNFSFKVKNGYVRRLHFCRSIKSVYFSRIYLGIRSESSQSGPSWPKLWPQYDWVGIHAPLGPRTARCELVRYFSVFIGTGAVRSEFFKKKIGSGAPPSPRINRLWCVDSWLWLAYQNRVLVSIMIPFY